MAVNGDSIFPVNSFLEVACKFFDSKNVMIPTRRYSLCNANIQRLMRQYFY